MTAIEWVCFGVVIFLGGLLGLIASRLGSEDDE